jgi:hypothetical protein
MKTKGRCGKLAMKARMSMKKGRLAQQLGNVGQYKGVIRRLWMDVPRETTALGAVPISGVAPACSP